MSAVPIIDISGFLAGGPEAAAIARQVDDTFRNVGFLVITGHGVDPELLLETRDVMQSFFQQPFDEKKKVGVTSNNFRGWREPNATALAKSMGNESPPDLMERFTVGRSDVPDDEYHNARRTSFFQDNRFPAYPARLEAVARRYFAEMESLGGKLMRLFAAALGMPLDYFDAYFDRHISQFVTNYYPELKTVPTPGQQRAGAHTDYGSLTILNPAIPSGGLQVKGRDGEWSFVPMHEGSFVINIGDLLAQWTNDRWVSNLHRVVIPDEATPDAAMSLVYFQQANDDAMISCIATCTDASNPPKHAPIAAGAHVAAKLERAWIGKKRLEDVY